MKISDRIRAFAVVSVIFFAFSLFAEAEQTGEKPAEEVKAEGSSETKADESDKQNSGSAVEEKAEQQLDAATETNPEEAAEVKPEEAKPEETAEAQNGSNESIEVEVVDETENFVFSARSLDKMTWEEAQNYCKNLDFYGEKWHLPNIDELRQIVRNCPATEAGGSCRVSEEGNCLSGNCSAPKESCTCERKAKNRGHYSMFGDADYIGLWSSSTLSNDAGKAWGAVFYSGMIGSVGKNSKLYARCVHKTKSKGEGADDLYAITCEKKDKKTENGTKSYHDIIDENLNKKDKEISNCIYKGSRGDKDFTHGSVSIEYEIVPTGDISYFGVQMSTVGNLTIENCMAEVIKSVKFPPFKEDGTRIYGNRLYKFSIKRKK